MHSDAGLSAISNILGLGVSFLCGVFIPIDMMSPALKAFSSYIPVFWYEQALEIIGNCGSVHQAIIKVRPLLLQQGIAVLVAFILFGIITSFANRRKSIV